MSTKVAIITGGSRGLGKSMALHLAQKGTDVIFTYNSQKTEADKVVSEIEKRGRKAVAIQLDASKVAGFKKFTEEVQVALQTQWHRKNFDYLVNNAGTALYSPILETTEEQFDQVVNIHFKGVYFLTQKLIPLIADGGRILNISSGLTRMSMPGSSAYASVKGAVEVFTRYLAKELSPRKISVNTVAPGAIATDFGNGHVRDNPETNKMVASITALGRVGEADDIGGVVAALLSNETAWMTGQRIEVSGGMLL